MINIAWDRSFGNKKNAKKALSERGWNPLNRALLLDKAILKTRKTLPGLAAQWAIRSKRESPAKPKPQQPMPGLSREGIRDEEDSDDEGGGTTNLHDQLVCI